MIAFVEWGAFGGILVATWLYGNGGRAGPALGIVSACLFITYGLLASVPAAWATNIAFAVIHARNFAKTKP